MEKFIYPKELPKNIVAFTTTRYGGYSKEPYKSLNLGYSTNDNILNIMRNYNYVKLYHNINKLQILNQVHGSKVIEIKEDNLIESYLTDGDGLFTTCKDMTLGVLTADCYPILLVGKKGIAALHAGWRSLNKGIIENALEFFIKYKDFPIYAYIGAGICVNCYYVKDDMVKLLNISYKPNECLLKVEKGIYKLNLQQLVVNALIFNNIFNIYKEKVSSCCSDTLFSYRRDIGNTGRMLTAIKINI